MFGTEAEETYELCRELIADLMQLPADRFYAGEQIALTQAMLGIFRPEQGLLDWLFELRRVTGENLEGAVHYYNWAGQEYPECRSERREILLPNMSRIG
jgi:hypothetical protein